MTDFLDALTRWIADIPIPALYVILWVIAFLEGVFPPIPADVVTALLSFLAARRGANFELTVVAIVTGSVAGAMVVYAVARRFGADWLHARLRKAGIENLEQRLEAMYSHYGMAALFVCRLLPGFRMITPPMAGATRVPPIRTAVVFTAASALWYGAIAWIAFRVGDDWEDVRAAINRFAERVGLAAVIVAVVLAGVVVVAYRRRAARRRKEALENPPPGA